MPDGPVFSRGVRRLKDQQYGVTVRRVVKLLHSAELGDVLLQQTLVLILGFVDGIDLRRPLLRWTLLPSRTRKSLQSIFM